MASIVCSFILLISFIAVSAVQNQQHLGRQSTVGMFPSSRYTFPAQVEKPNVQSRTPNSKIAIFGVDEHSAGQPTGRPTTDPSSQPSSIPSGEPTGQPTSEPTAQPSGQQSSYPTREPTKYEEPTNVPSGQPSSQPSSWPSTTPSRQPVSVPSSQPTVQPSNQPTRSPFADPTGQPTVQPSSQPSSTPSYSPSSMPTPGGDLAVNWWYLVSSRCEITADDLNTYSDSEILDSVVSAFAFVLTDPLNDVERETVEVSAELITSSSNADRATALQPKAVAVNVDNSWVVRWSSHTRDERFLNAIGEQDNKISTLQKVQQVQKTRKVSTKRLLTTTQNRAYFIEAWCPDHPTALKVYQAMERAATTPSEIIEPLHEHGLHEVTNATISHIALSTTTDLPPSLSDDSLSPVRITWIILGTIALFALGLLLLSRVKYLKYLYCSKTCVEDMLRSWYNILADGCMMCLRSVGLVSSDLHLYYGSGFDLTTQEEEADFYGEHRGNLPSDNLDIHYGGDKKNQRSTYLEDDEDGHGGKKAGSSRSGIGKLFTRLRGQRDAPPVPPTPPSRHSPDSHSIELSNIHNNSSFSDRNSKPHGAFSTRNETVVSPLTTRLSGNSSYAPSTGSPFQIRSVGYGQRLPADMYRPVGDDLDDIGGFSPVISANSSTHNSKHGSKDYESFVV